MRNIFITIIAVLTFTLSACSSGSTQYRNIEMPAGSYVADFSTQGTPSGNLWFYQQANVATATAIATELGTSWRPTSIAFNGGYAYVAADTELWLYQVSSNGTLTNGQNALNSLPPSNYNPSYIAFNNNLAYVVSPNGISIFSIDQTGGLNVLNEATTSPSTPVGIESTAIWTPTQISFNGDYAYVAGTFFESDSLTITGLVSVYSVNESNGALTYQSDLSSTYPNFVTSVAINNGFAYVGGVTANLNNGTTQDNISGGLYGQVSAYQIESNGSLASSPTQVLTNPVGTDISIWLPSSITFYQGKAYITNMYTFNAYKATSGGLALQAAASNISVYTLNGNTLDYEGTAIPLSNDITAYWDPIQVAFNPQTSSTGGLLTTSIESANFVINTESPSLESVSTTLTLTNSGTGPAYNININAQLPIQVTSSTCATNLESGESCSIVLSAKTSYNFAGESAQAGSTSYQITYFNGSQTSLSIPVTYNIEQWRGTLFITAESTTGAIVYGSESGVNAADLYCQNDINNPNNGYNYKAVISDNVTRTPTSTSWVLEPTESYYSVVENVYNQPVLQTTSNSVFPTAPTNCISLNCAAATGPNNHDLYTWTGFPLTNQTGTQNTCNTWSSNLNSNTGTGNRISKISALATVPGVESANETCDNQRPIMCAAQ